MYEELPSNCAESFICSCSLWDFTVIGSRFDRNIPGTTDSLAGITCCILYPDLVVQSYTAHPVIADTHAKDAPLPHVLLDKVRKGRRSIDNQEVIGIIQITIYVREVEVELGLKRARAIALCLAGTATARHLAKVYGVYNRRVTLRARSTAVVLAVAVLVDAIVRDFWRAWVDRSIVVITILRSVVTIAVGIYTHWFRQFTESVWATESRAIYKILAVIVIEAGRNGLFRIKTVDNVIIIAHGVTA